MTTQPPQRSNLEDSLARLSQQMEDVEGRFNKLIGQDATSQRYSNRGSHVDSTVYRSSNNQSSHLKFNESPSYQQRNYSYSTNVNPLEQPRSSQPSFPGIERTYSVVTNDVTPAGNQYRYSETVKRSGSPVKHQHEDFSAPSKTIHTTTTYEIKPTPQTTETKPTKTDEDYPSHDFNDKELLALILNENSALKNGSSPSKTTYVHSHDPLKYENVKRSYILESQGSHTPIMTNAKVEEILRNIAAERASTGNAGNTDRKLYSKPEDMKTYTSVTTTYSPSRDQSEAVKRSSRPPAAQETQSTSVRNTEYVVSKSSVQYDNVYVPSQTYTTTTTTTYQNTSPSNDNKKVEEWQYKKYLNESAKAEEEEEADSGFCGLFVTKKSKAKQTTEVVKKEEVKK